MYGNMKCLPAIFLLFVVVYPGNCLRLPDETWAREILEVSIKNNTNNSLPKALGEEDDCGGKIFSCQDCKTSRVCSYNNEGKKVVSKVSQCPTERPWCEPNTGSCTKNEPPSCGQDNSDFVCLRKSHYFPSDDCHRFYFCDDNYQAKQLECKPNDHVFNPDTQLCEAPSITTTCGSFKCQGNAIKKVKHSRFQRFYALCNLESEHTPIVAVNLCPEHYTISEKNQICEPDCANAVNIKIPDPTNCHNFYTCEVETIDEVFSRTVAKINTCPSGLAYDAKEHMCLDESTVLNCKQHPHLFD